MDEYDDKPFITHFIYYKIQNEDKDVWFFTQSFYSKIFSIHFKTVVVNDDENIENYKQTYFLTMLPLIEVQENWISLQKLTFFIKDRYDDCFWYPPDITIFENEYSSWIMILSFLHERQTIEESYWIHKKVSYDSSVQKWHQKVQYKFEES